MNKKEYRIADLSVILGISEVAIRKKVKDGLYKQRYEVVTKLFNNKQTAFILLSDVELEEEKKIASANKNKFYGQKVEHNVEDNDFIEVEPEKEQFNNNSQDDFKEFTKLYLSKIDNLYQSLYTTQQETLQKDKQIYLLETSESRIKSDILEVQAENKTLKLQNKRYLIALIISLCLCTMLCMPLFYILLKRFI